MTGILPVVIEGINSKDALLFRKMKNNGLTAFQL